MFYHLLYPLNKYISFFRVFQYISFRAAGAFVTALFIAFIFGPKIIKYLKKHNYTESISEYIPEHNSKAGTPSMGGVIIIIGLFLSVLLWNDLLNSYIQILILAILWLGGLGFIDDYLKNVKNAKRGLIAKYKIYGQVVLGIFVAVVVYCSSSDKAVATSISIPFFKNLHPSLSYFFFPFVIFVIVATSNAVNLTDGLDGLSSGCIAFSALGLGIMAYLKGNFKTASYLNLEFLPNVGELTIFTTAIIGTIMGFLWFNTKPAAIFMGDTGSLSLGGILAILSVLLKEEIFFAIVGGVFVIEALSSLIQRYYFKYTRIKTGQGQRVFLRAPLHHHFELKGWPEEKIVVRFWIIAALLLVIGLSTIKLR